MSLERTRIGEFAPVLADGIMRLEDWLPYQCSFVANRVSAVLASVYRDKFKVSPSGWRVVAVLATHDPMSAKELAELTGMDQTNITRAVASLMEERVVLRKVDNEDRRRVVLSLGARGRQIFAQVEPLARSVEESLVSGLTEDELRVLRKAMRKVLDAAAVAWP